MASNPFDDESGGNPFGDDDEDGDNPFSINGEKDNPFDGTHEQNKPPKPRPKKAAAPPPPKTAVSPLNETIAPNSVPVSVTPKLKLKTSASIVKSLIPIEESTAQHHELFLQEIEAVDEYWGPTFRGVYESGQHEVFLDRLEERIKKHDKDIEKMCSHHYQGFIESVRDLLRVRSQAEISTK